MRIKPNGKYNTESLEYENRFILQLVLTPAYGKLFKRQSFLMKGLQNMYLSVLLDSQNYWINYQDGLPTRTVKIRKNQIESLHGE